MNVEVSGRRKDLEKRLRSVNELFEHEMRVRGFDPAQAENSALPANLARIYQERQLLLEEIDNLDSKDAPQGEHAED